VLLELMILLEPARDDAVVRAVLRLVELQSLLLLLLLQLLFCRLLGDDVGDDSTWWLWCRW